jgi:hypothetical protein
VKGITYNQDLHNRARIHFANALRVYLLKGHMMANLPQPTIMVHAWGPAN